MTDCHQTGFWIVPALLCFVDVVPVFVIFSVQPAVRWVKPVVNLVFLGWASKFLLYPDGFGSLSVGCFVRITRWLYHTWVRWNAVGFDALVQRHGVERLWVGGRNVFCLVGTGLTQPILLICRVDR